jgi:exo-1,4-beta-D-glucosaminidase
MEIMMGADRYQALFSIPQISKISPVYFVRLELVDNVGKILSSNLYWESFKTPTDFSSLSNIENVKLDLSYKVEETKGEYLVHVNVKNPTKNLSFMNRLAIIRKDNNEEVLPTFWDDNFITLFPGEEKTVEAKFANKDLNDSAFSVVVDNNR